MGVGVYSKTQRGEVVNYYGNILTILSPSPNTKIAGKVWPPSAIDYILLGVRFEFVQAGRYAPIVFLLVAVHASYLVNFI